MGPSDVPNQDQIHTADGAVNLSLAPGPATSLQAKYPRMLITALLHDTIEDTTTDFDDIDKIHGQEIARWVAFLTKNKALPEPDREADYIQRLLQAPWQVQVCKLADVFDNLIDLAQLAPDRRGHSLERAEQYLKALQAAPAAELRKPLAMVLQLLTEIKAQHG